MIRELRGHDMGQQSRTRDASINRSRRRRSLHDNVASSAAQLGPHMANHLEVGGDVLEQFGNIFAELRQRATTLRTAWSSGRVSLGLTWQMIRQCTARLGC